MRRWAAYPCRSSACPWRSGSQCGPSAWCPARPWASGAPPRRPGGGRPLTAAARPCGRAASGSRPGPPCSARGARRRRASQGSPRPRRCASQTTAPARAWSPGSQCSSAGSCRRARRRWPRPSRGQRRTTPCSSAPQPHALPRWSRTGPRPAPRPAAAPPAAAGRPAPARHPPQEAPAQLSPTAPVRPCLRPAFPRAKAVSGSAAVTGVSQPAPRKTLQC
mmetsp:Transcript_66452/g.214156  ORF Transcript_66452/g.214156 Transcript_66452/m.214156 type:complete len:220 (-) Transcript_66452:783-1442(-)